MDQSSNRSFHDLPMCEMNVIDLHCYLWEYELIENQSHDCIQKNQTMKQAQICGL